MLKPFDHLESVMEENSHRQNYIDSNLLFFVSDIMKFLNIADDAEINRSIDRAFHAYYALSIPIEINFKKVYLFDGENIISDWKISPLAVYLIIINCDPRNRNIAKAQLFFAGFKTGL